MSRGSRPLTPNPSPQRGEGGRSGPVVLFALEREAAPFRRAVPGLRVEVCGVGLRRAAAAAERVLAEGPSFVVMAGFCGALRGGLPVGAVVTPAEVVDEYGGRWAVSHEPESAEASAAPSRLLTAARLVATPADKHALAARFAADVVDMESAAVAAACAKRGVPFLAVRAVSDAVETALSPELVRLLAGGDVSVPRACLALIRRPALLGEFRRLARDTKRTADALAAALVVMLARSAVSSGSGTPAGPGTAAAGPPARGSR